MATPTDIMGTILGVEKKQQAISEEKIPSVVSVEYLNLVTNEGLRSLALDQIQQIRFVDDRLNRELHQALAVLATGHDSQKKLVTVLFDGEGPWQARLAYMMETPVCKTSYRLLLNQDGSPFLQGWAIVENTTDHDWDAVQLSLMSGRPISFIMDLYQPLYTDRPVVEPELHASLRPSVHEDAMDTPRSMEPTSKSKKLAGRRDRVQPEAFAAGQAMMQTAPSSESALQMDMTQGVSAAAGARRQESCFSIRYRHR